MIPESMKKGKMLIELKEITRKFGELTAVNRVSLTVPEGQIFGYLGPNGAGKTTTVKMLTGMLPPSEGTASVSGYDIREYPLEVKKRIGYVPESGALYESLTPEEYLQLVGRLYRMSESSINSRVTEFIEFFGLEKDRGRPMTEFSRGMKQKVVIASALIHSPEVIFMDEPLSGLDANAALLLKSLIRNLADEGRTVFYCSHVLEVVENLCDRVVILDKGKVVADGSVTRLKKMTSQSSLEKVFSRLTHAEDLGEAARAFSRRITGKEKSDE
jgi:ABC-2 type transport system ATP-binding protein